MIFMEKRPRWGIVHFRFGQRDGVSLEIDKRLQILSELGVDFLLIGGTRHPHFRRQSHYFPALDLQQASASQLLSQLFQRPPSPSLVSRYRYWEAQLEEQWRQLLDCLQLDLLVVHNLFSLPLVLPAAQALATVIQQRRQRTLAIHHDFWFNRHYLRPNHRFVRSILTSLPPRAPFIDHQVINSRDQAMLWRQRRIRARRIGDYWDFQWRPAKDLAQFPFHRHFHIHPQTELILLQATRIVPRKGIANSIHFVAVLNKILAAGGYPYRRAVLFLSNFVELGFEDYGRRLRRLAGQLGVRVIWAGRQFGTNGDGLSFWIPYHFAHLVMYPSLEEGFGNQFLEAVAFRRPVVLFEYPVFRQDLRPEGYRYISLGGRVYRRYGFSLVPRARLEEAAREALSWLGEKREDWLEENWRIARRYHGLANLRRELQRYLN